MHITDQYLMRNPLRMVRDRLLTRTVAPACEPVSLEEAKLYLRVDSDEDDTLIDDLITASRMMAEQWLRRSLITQTWKLAYDDGIAERVWLPMGPVSAITSLAVVSSNDSSQTIDSDAYWLNAAKTELTMNSALIGFRVEISYTAGYGAAADVPKPIKQGMLAHMAAMYDNRGDLANTVLPDQCIGLYAPYREVHL